MTHRPPSCDRSWEAEAVADRRLSNTDRASFERHAANCRTCAAEVRRLTLLQETAARLPKAESTPLEHRRQRGELLRRANTQVMRGSFAATPARRRLIFAVACAALVAAGGAFAAWSHAPAARLAASASTATGTSASGAAPAPPAESVPTFQISTSENAQWQRVDSGSTVRVSVVRGRFTVSVDKLKSGQRFLLDLPDGELEVQGTRFEVELDGGHTRSVRVFEGRVALRLRGQEARSLGADESFVAAPPPITSATVAPTARPVATPSSVGPTVQSSDPPAVASAPPAPAASSSATTDLGAALSAFSAGDYGRAESLFSAFQVKHPDDARVEDAAFLIALARSRRGDVSGARAAAADYLRRYPNGFRRQEATRLAAE